MEISCINLSYWDVTFFLFFFLLIIMWMRQRRPKNFPPGPTALPVIGNFHNLTNKDFLQTIRSLRKTYGDIFSLSLGSFWVIVVNGSDNLRELLVKRGTVTTDRPPFFMFKISNNKGVVGSSGIPWKHQRTFALSKLRDFGFGKRSFENAIQTEIERFLSLLDSFHGKAFDISRPLQISMANNIMSITLGRRFDYDDKNFKYFTHILDQIASNKAFSGPLNFAPFLAKVPFDPFEGKSIIDDSNRIYDFLMEEIKEHERTLDENNIRDFIDAYLVETKEHSDYERIDFSIEQLQRVLGDLFGAGTETTATTIKWAILFFLNNPDKQHKMWKEIDEVVGSGRLPSISDKPNLSYCEAVVLESLRLGNIVPYSLPHYVTEDIHYKGMHIPKNSVILPSLDSVAFDEELFPDCHSFKPERFLDENGKLTGQDNILTFSLGRRVCLGESLARMELYLNLTALVQRFEFLPPEGKNPPKIEGKLGITFSPHTYEMRAIPRQ